MADDRSLGEAHRRLDDHGRRLDDKVDKGVYNADKDALAARHTRTEKDIEQLYGRVRTFIWLVLGAVAGGVVAEVMKTVFSHA